MRARSPSDGTPAASETIASTKRRWSLALRSRFAGARVWAHAAPSDRSMRSRKASTTSCSCSGPSSRRASSAARRSSGVAADSGATGAGCTCSEAVAATDADLLPSGSDFLHSRHSRTEDNTHGKDHRHRPRHDQLAAWPCSRAASRPSSRTPRAAARRRPSSRSRRTASGSSARPRSASRSRTRENTVFSIKRFMGRKCDEVSEEMTIVPYEVVEGPERRRPREGGRQGVRAAGDLAR